MGRSSSNPTRIFSRTSLNSVAVAHYRFSSIWPPSLLTTVDRYTALGEARYFGRSAGEVDLPRRISRSSSNSCECRRYPRSAYRRIGIESAGTKVDVKSAWRTNKVYLCPRDIFVHRGLPSRCGQACQKAKDAVGGYAML